MLRFLGNTLAAKGRMQFGRRGVSSIASAPMSSRVKHVWEEQNKLVLGLAFIGGWFGKASINVYKRREDWYRIHRFIDDEDKRLEELRAFIQKESENLKELLDDPAVISAIDEETEFNALVEEEAALLESLLGEEI